jgi:hypothetical protein
VSQEMQAQLGLSKQAAQSVTVVEQGSGAATRRIVQHCSVHREQGKGAATRRIAQQRPGERACREMKPALHVPRVACT